MVNDSDCTDESDEHDETDEEYVQSSASESADECADSDDSASQPVLCEASDGTITGLADETSAVVGLVGLVKRLPPNQPVSICAITNKPPGEP